MKYFKLFWIVNTFIFISIGKAIGQKSVTYYYDDKEIGVETLKKCTTYKVFKIDNQQKPIGEIRKYYNTGELMAIGESALFIDKLNDLNSIYCGNIAIYYKSGKLQETCYRNQKGVLVGENIQYYESGKIKAKATYDLTGGIIGAVIFYYENGLISAQLPYKLGALNGLGIYYNESGRKSAEIEFLNGAPKYDWYFEFDEQGLSYKYDVKSKEPYTYKNEANNFSNEPKEIKTFYNEGKTFQYYIHNGISVTMHLSIEKNYGKYYVAYISIENLTGNAFNFNPDKISATLKNKGKEFSGEVLSNNEYIKKVNNRQAWNSALIALGESYSASQAGYSSSSTSSTASGYANSYGSASGYYGNTYGSVYGSSSTYGTTTTNSYTESYNAGASYAAQQNAQQNISNFQNQQYEIKNELNQGYLKLNTIYNEDRIIGQVNIRFKTAESIKISIPLNGVIYDFLWTTN